MANPARDRAVEARSVHPATRSAAKRGATSGAVEASDGLPLRSLEPSQPPAGEWWWIATTAIFDRRGRRRSRDECTVPARNAERALAQAAVELGAEPGAIIATRWRQVCPCETDVEDIGPGHVDGCPFGDPEYCEGMP